MDRRHQPVFHAEFLVQNFDDRRQALVVQEPMEMMKCLLLS